MVLRLSRKQKVLGSIPSVAFLCFPLFVFSAVVFVVFCSHVEFHTREGMLLCLRRKTGAFP